MQSGHPEFGQTSYPQYGYPTGITVQSNSGHDMNKPVAAGQPGLYPNSSGIPAAAPQHHHQASMAGQVPSPQNATLVQQGQQMNRSGHLQTMQMGGYYTGRPNVPRNIPNISRNQLSMINQTGQQTSQYSQQVSMVQAGFATHPMQTLVVSSNFSTYPPQRTYPSQPFGVIPTQGMFMNNCYAYSNPQPSSNGFYPTHGITQYNSHGLPPQMSQQQVPVQPVQPQQQKKILIFINPETMEPVKLTDNESTTNLKPEKEVENSDPAICAQFATQVAAVALRENSDKVGKQGKVEDPRIPDSPSVVLCPNEIEPQYNSEVDKGMLEHETLQLDQQTKIDDELNNSSGVEYGENCNISSCEETNIVMYKNDLNPKSINDQLYGDKCSVQIVDPLSSEIKDPKLSTIMLDENLGAFKTDHGLHPDPNSAPVELSGYSKTSEIPQVPAPEETVSLVYSELATSNQMKEDLKTQAIYSELQDTTVNSKSTEKLSEGKKNKTKKKKDYNKRGESKEGGEMDAFLDKPEDSSMVVPPTPPVTALPPERLPSPVPIVDRDILSTIPLPDEIVDNLPRNISPSEPISDSPSDSPVAETEDKENVEELITKISPKYNYKEDQWSPLNPEGKKQYDRDFLLRLQEQPMSLCKPLNLPNLEVIKDKANIHKLNEASRLMPSMIQTLSVRKIYDPFMPNYARGAAGVPHPAINRRSQQGRGEKARKVISFQSSLGQSVKLHESENAWKPSRKGEAISDLPTDEVEKEKLKRSVQAVLNKLTPQKFETLLQQLKNLNIDTEEKLKVVIDLIFEKAIDEPNFSVSYASMCKQLALTKVPLAGQPGSFVNFRKLILTKCQKEFEQDSKDQFNHEERQKAIQAAEGDKKKELQLEVDEEEKRMRYRQLGNIRFIGELFKFGMLIEPIMHECIKKLLSQGDDESLECLCRLLKTIGKELDPVKQNKSSREMEYYFSQMQRIVDERMTSSRVRFMLQDVIDLKKNNWVPRRDENNPKTIDQIHKEAEREAREQQQVYQNIPNFPKRMPDDRDKRKGTARNQTEDGWTPSSKSKGSYNVLDPMKLKLTKPDEVESMRLGPGGRGLSSWGRGSSGGTKAPTESDVKTTVQNRYSALSEQPLTSSYDARRGSQRSAASSRESSRGRSNQLPTSVRKTASTSKERESLLETVKGLARGSEPKAQENKKSSDYQLNGKALDADDLLLKGPDYSENQIETKTKPLIEEFLHNNDFEEAIKCVTELASPQTVHLFIGFAINHVLERSSQARLSLGQLLFSLVKKKIITPDHYKKGFFGILEYLDDFALDIPLIFEYIGEILEPVTDDNELPLSFLKELLEPCIPSESAGLIMSAVLHCSAKKKGTLKLGESWEKSGLQWSDFLGSKINLVEFVTKNELKFTLSPLKVKTDVQMPLEEIQRSLTSLFEETLRHEAIFDWIDANVSQTSDPNFIRALVTAVHSHVISGPGSKCELDATKLKALTPVLTRYIDHDSNLELQALYAIQVLMNDLGHPSGFLRQIFDTLYDEDVITEKVFYSWEQSDDPLEMEGKGVAVHSVKSFFTWLRDVESQDDVSSDA